MLLVIPMCNPTARVNNKKRNVYASFETLFRYAVPKRNTRETQFEYNMPLQEVNRNAALYVVRTFQQKLKESFSRTKVSRSVAVNWKNYETL